MKITETFLKGCYIIEPEVYKDNRGIFFESFNKKVFEEKLGCKINFVQHNQSVSKKGVIRGLHMQKGAFGQAKLVNVIKGKVLDVVVDCRKDSKTFGQYFSIELSRENNKHLFIPRNFLHGFASLEDDTIFTYKCDNYYHKEAEVGVIYNDEDLNIDWGLNEVEIVLSKKDGKLNAFR